MNQRQRFLTPEGRDRLREELDELRIVRRPDVAARIHIATEGGGTVDNAEYEEVKNEQSFVEGRIRDLEQVLANAVVAERSPDAGDKTQIGSSVTVKAQDGRLRKYQLVGSAEANPLEGKISNESPVGEALLDRQVGDVVEYKTPGGLQKLTVVKID
jgi:transcription elongation factor GreA